MREGGQEGRAEREREREGGRGTCTRFQEGPKSYQAFPGSRQPRHPSQCLEMRVREGRRDGKAARGKDEGERE